MADTRSNGIIYRLDRSSSRNIYELFRELNKRPCKQAVREEIRSENV